MPNGIRAVQSDTPEVLLEFLEVCFNSILFNRKVYPASIFVLKKKYSIPVHVSIFPDLNQYIFQVLSAVKHVYIANELKLISLCILNEDFVPIEKYNFNFGAASNPWPSSTLQATSSNKTLVDLSDIYDSFRSFCLKLSVLDNSLKCTKNTSFKIYIETKESAQHKIFKEPQFENFPWIPERAANGETEAELIPLNTISTGSIHLQIYVEV